MTVGEGRLDVPGLPAGHRLVSIADEFDLWVPADRMCGSSWPEFMLHDPVAQRDWDYLETAWPQFQLVMADDEGRIAAASQAAPLWWDGSDDGLPEGWDDQFDGSVADLKAGRKPNSLGAIQICVAADRRGRGLSAVMLEGMRRTGIAAGLTSLMACVRPTDKSRYPLMPIETYAAWRRPDGLPVDPWLRVHERAGARLVRPSPHSMAIAGTIAEWQKWTGLSFPVSGPYMVEGALNPVEVDLAADSAVYYDPNVWMVHPLT